MLPARRRILEMWLSQSRLSVYAYIINRTDARLHVAAGRITNCGGTWLDIGDGTGTGRWSSLGQSPKLAPVTAPAPTQMRSSACDCKRAQPLLIQPLCGVNGLKGREDVFEATGSIAIRHRYKSNVFLEIYRPSTVLATHYRHMDMMSKGQVRWSLRELPLTVLIRRK